MARWILDRSNVSVSDRSLALADLDRAIQLGARDSQEQARDFAEKGRVLLMNGRSRRRVDACDAAIRINPQDGQVLRYRVGRAFGTQVRERDAIVACDAALRAGLKSADLLGLRGLARTRRNEFAAAIDDYTLAWPWPSSAVLHGRRGWAYLVSGAAQLAVATLRRLFASIRHAGTFTAVEDQH